MKITINGKEITLASLYATHPQIVRTEGDKAYDAQGYEVLIDFTAIAQYEQSTAYRGLRAAEFAKKSIAEQMDMMYWDKVNGTTHHQDWAAGIKTMHPKP